MITTLGKKDSPLAACGERITVTIVTWNEKGAKAKEETLTLTLGKKERDDALDAALVGTAVGETRLVILPPAEEMLPNAGKRVVLATEKTQLVSVTRVH